MVVNMEIGMITPPVGLNLFVTSGVANMSVMGVVRAALPFLGILFVFLVLVTYVPFISTWLPTLLMGPELIVR
jgi:C4-dicarboxylate transporter, DctM subunit